MRRYLPFALALLLVATIGAQTQPSFSPITNRCIAFDSPVIALQHVRVIDGTGAAPSDDQTLMVENGNIREIGPSASMKIPEAARALDLSATQSFLVSSACTITCFIPRLPAQ